MSLRLARLAAIAVSGAAAAAVTAPAADAAYFTSSPTNYQGICRNADSFKGLGASTLKSVFLSDWGARIVPDPTNPAAADGPNAVGFGYDVSLDYPQCSIYKTAADGGTKSVSYSPTGSGSGLSAFGMRGGARAYSGVTDFMFIGTDDPPTEQQIAQAEANNADHPSESQLLTIPVAQVAITAATRLPDGCQVPASYRNLTRDAVEAAFAGTKTTWGELYGDRIQAVAGSGKTNADCRGITFVRVVRKDVSGSTFLFKRYLEAAARKAGASTDWRDKDSEGGTYGNVEWPAPGGAPAVVRGSSNGAGALLDALAAQSANGGIGYADIATMRSKDFGWSYNGSYDQADAKFWNKVQRIENDDIISPAVNNAQNASGGQAGAQCTGVTYRDVPSDLGGSWFNTSAVLTPIDYPVCGLTYFVAPMWGYDTKASDNTPFRRLVQPGTSQAQYRGMKDFMKYVTGQVRPGAGPGKLAPAGYQKVPAAINAKAQSATNKLGWYRASNDPAPADPVNP